MATHLPAEANRLPLQPILAIGTMGVSGDERLLDTEMDVHLGRRPLPGAAEDLAPAATSAPEPAAMAPADQEPSNRAPPRPEEKEDPQPEDKETPPPAATEKPSLPPPALPEER